MVLIVDDNPQVRRMIRQLVEDIDADVCECDDGTEACDAFANHHPDWVLMDLAMPGMDGLTATRQLIQRFPDAKIAIVTNYDDVAMRRAARAAGACEYIVKDNLNDLRRLFAH